MIKSCFQMFKSVLIAVGPNVEIDEVILQSHVHVLGKTKIDEMIYCCLN